MSTRGITSPPAWRRWTSARASVPFAGLCRSAFTAPTVIVYVPQTPQRSSISAVALRDPRADPPQRRQVMSTIDTLHLAGN